MIFDTEYQTEDLGFDTIFAVEHNSKHRFTQVLNESLWDPRLSCKAGWVWVRCLSRPKDWKFYIKELSNHFQECEKTIRKALKELIDLRYAHRMTYHQQDEKGKFKKGKNVNVYVFFEVPATDKEIAILEEKFKKFYRNGKKGHSLKCPLQIPIPNQYVKRKKQTKKESHTEEIDASLRSAEKVSSSSILKEADEIPRSPPKPPPKKTTPKKLTASEPVQEVASSHPEALNYLKTFGRPLVGLTPTEYKKIVDKLGEPAASEWIQELADWKASNALSGDKAHLKHSDAYRIVRWASKAKRDAEKRSLNTGQIKAILDDSAKSNKTAAMERCKGLSQTQGKVEFLNKHVEIGTSPFLTCINYSEKGFMEQFENALRKWRLL